VAEKKIVIYTAIANQFDDLIDPPFVSAECDYVCFTDNSFSRSDIWKIREFDEYFPDPTMTAKKPKILPHRYFPDYEYSVWVDGNMSIIGDIRELIERYLGRKPMALYRHPEGRSSIYEEAEACVRLGKDDKDIIERQMNRYRMEGYSYEQGIPAAMVVLRRHRARKVVDTMEDWWQEVLSFSRRDQLSFHFVAWKNRLEYAVIDDNVRDNAYFKWRPHDSKAKSQRLEKRIADSDIVFLSFPKSGRTWARHFLAKYVEKEFGHPFSYDFPGQKGVPRIVFTHNYFDLYQDQKASPDILFGDQIAKKRLVLLVRDPRDVLVSYYYQKKEREQLPIHSLVQFADSEIYGVERQGDFVLKCLNFFKYHKQEKLCLAYERIHADTERQMLALLEFVFRDRINEKSFRFALEESRFDRMQAFEEDISLSGRTDLVFHRLGNSGWDGNRDALKVRKGKVRGYRDEMDLLTRLRILFKPNCFRLIMRLWWLRRR
jgi:hypothetical protein